MIRFGLSLDGTQIALVVAISHPKLQTDMTSFLFNPSPLLLIVFVSQQESLECDQLA